MSENLLQSVEDGIATLTLNRPEALNAFTASMTADLEASLVQLAKDDSVRLVILTGAGKAFSAGGDVKGFASRADGELPASFESRSQDLRSRMEVSRLLHEMPKPTMAVIPGPAAGAGFSLALACDMRIAAAEAKLTTAFANVGLTGDFGGSYFLTHLVGSAMARELYFTARVMKGDEAHALGIVNRVVPYAELAEAAKAYAIEIAQRPTIALGYMKRNLNIALHGSLSDVLDAEAIHMTRAFETADHKGAAKAFVEKRKPVFVGR
ncbi:MAG: enoyl-CoA hydratase [Burkholderiaceae bacterium]